MVGSLLPLFIRDKILVRWDLKLRELILTIAHEARHLWHAAQGCPIDIEVKDVECEDFALKAIKEISGGAQCN
ncbi:MAG: hypothetical protein MUF02_02975 [Acidobacteria bacterium]|nr:hypothetical protein [Acidobacteriota bacterium]